MSFIGDIFSNKFFAFHQSKTNKDSVHYTQKADDKRYYITIRKAKSKKKGVKSE